MALALNNTPVTQHQYGDIHFYLKRDDLLHAHFSGNKARKLMSVLENDFPRVTTLVGYGSPQANSLLSIAALAQLKGWRCQFYVDRIPAWLRENPIGNYAHALKLGADVRVVAEQSQGEGLKPSEFIARFKQANDENLCLPEGGRSPLAEIGIKGLAEEILAWKKAQKLQQLHVALPSGTGTTSLYLQKHLQNANIKVLTCACVGGEDYLKSQWLSLSDTCHPTILAAPRKHHFGKLYQDDYQCWQDLKQTTGVEFELLYDPLMWHCLTHYFQRFPEMKHVPLLYIHQGGLIGNESMLPRYQRRFK
ncbi:1-aminocyclopropane-1-carboxylate deaminase/D-cysteine desulfhydrase [Thaumasiovibrio subtropicus]|uniref:1-aminocyclopropane-1-carboxylate deaminase/D-cysteine desulfhydrase n=1 Tax=Thaumasiovibrio subtropicus TaxID=1891207 RepID=UPI000B3536CF|nr:1-aminocyclopropane-1-carboxylate deaminase/D-cysteine desulfhydrase [Thaumasiovibrio subtropicus]